VYGSGSMAVLFWSWPPHHPGPARSFKATAWLLQHCRDRRPCCTRLPSQAITGAVERVSVCSLVGWLVWCCSVAGWRAAALAAGAWSGAQLLTCAHVVRPASPGVCMQRVCPQFGCPPRRRFPGRCAWLRPLLPALSGQSGTAQGVEGGEVRANREKLQSWAMVLLQQRGMRRQPGPCLMPAAPAAVRASVRWVDKHNPAVPAAGVVSVLPHCRPWCGSVCWCAFCMERHHAVSLCCCVASACFHTGFHRLDCQPVSEWRAAPIWLPLCESVGRLPTPLGYAGFPVASTTAWLAARACMHAGWWCGLHAWSHMVGATHGGNERFLEPGTWQRGVCPAWVLE
jgi:hypothetical protein